MGASLLLDQTKTTDDFVGTDLVESIKAVKVIARRMKLVSTIAEERQIAAEAEAFYVKKEGWSAETRQKEEEVSPLAWWTEKRRRTVGSDYYYPLLARLATMIFTIPTSSASSERFWSIHDFVQTKRRNRLDGGRVEKLVFVYCNAGGKDSKTHICYRVFNESDSDVEEYDEGSAGESDSSEDSRSASSNDSDSNSGGDVQDTLSDSNAYAYDGSSHGSSDEQEQKFES